MISLVSMTEPHETQQFSLELCNIESKCFLRDQKGTLGAIGLGLNLGGARILLILPLAWPH